MASLDTIMIRYKPLGDALASLTEQVTPSVGGVGADVGMKAPDSLKTTKSRTRVFISVSINEKCWLGRNQDVDYEYH